MNGSFSGPEMGEDTKMERTHLDGSIGGTAAPTRVEPTGHYVLVRFTKVEERTAGGIYRPQTALDQHQKAATTGMLIAFGPQAWKAFGDGRPWAKIGDMVMFPRYSGITIDPAISGEDNLCLMNDEDIKGVLHTTPPTIEELEKILAGEHK